MKRALSSARPFAGRPFHWNDRCGEWTWAAKCGDLGMVAAMQPTLPLARSPARRRGRALTVALLAAWLAWEAAAIARAFAVGAPVLTAIWGVA